MILLGHLVFEFLDSYFVTTLILLFASWHLQETVYMLVFIFFLRTQLIFFPSLSILVYLDKLS